MASITRRALIAVGTATLLTGSILGTSAFAADPTPAAGAPAAGTPTAQTQKVNKGREFEQSFMSKLAAKLGVDSAKLTDSIKAAQTDTIDEAVQKGDLAKNQADAMKKRIADGQPGMMMPFGGPRGGERGMPGEAGVPGGFGVRDQAVQKAVADKLGITTDELTKQLKAGTSLSDIAKGKNVSDADLKAAAVAAEKAQLDQAVKDGKLTQAQADATLKRIEAAPLHLAGGMHRGR